MIETPLEESWLTEINGIGSATALKLLSKYDTVQALAAASPSLISTSLKIPNATAVLATISARDWLRENQQLAAEGEIDPAPKDADPVDPEGEELYVIRKRRIDPFTVVSERVLVTPSVCTMCGYDAAVAMGAEDWDTLPEANRVRAVSLLEEHKGRHTMGEVNLLRKKDLPTVSLRPIGSF